MPEETLATDPTLDTLPEASQPETTPEPVVELTLEQRKAQAIEANLDTPQTFLVRDYRTMTIRQIDTEIAGYNDAIRAYEDSIAAIKAKITVLNTKRADIVTKITKDIV